MSISLFWRRKYERELIKLLRLVSRETAFDALRSLPDDQINNLIAELRPLEKVIYTHMSLKWKVTSTDPKDL